MDRESFIRNNYQTMNNVALAEALGVSEVTIRRLLRQLKLKRKPPSLKILLPEEELAQDKKAITERIQKRDTKKLYEIALQTIDDLKKKLDLATQLKEVKGYNIKKYGGDGSGESVAVALASDWHIEESVDPAACGGMNFYNLEESQRRADRFFKVLLHLIQLEQKNTHIKTLVLGLLGDFISGDIHDDIVQSTLLSPTHAILRCQGYLISGIEFLLANSELNITLVCHSGNHGRKDKEQLVANEAGSSLEYLMYKAIAMYFRDNKRVKAIVPEGYHSYLDVFGLTLRFHHGHSIRYGGGVGGVTIPVNKAIAQWNKAKDARLAPFYESIKDTISEWNLARPADIDCFGHFHQFLDGGNFIANGSLIGYSPYGVWVKGGYEPPKQALFYIHSKYGHYDTRRILFDV